MIILNIQRDGSVYPPLSPGSLIVKLLNGNLEIGKYEKEFYMGGLYNYITEPGQQRGDPRYNDAYMFAV